MIKPQCANDQIAVRKKIFAHCKFFFAPRGLNTPLLHLYFQRIVGMIGVPQRFQIFVADANVGLVFHPPIESLRPVEELLQLGVEAIFVTVT
jgi:hypothetical protein